VQGSKQLLQLHSCLPLRSSERQQFVDVVGMAVMQAEHPHEHYRSLKTRTITTGVAVLARARVVKSAWQRFHGVRPTSFAQRWQNVRVPWRFRTCILALTPFK
jgi:hypothetical protein